LLKHAARDSQSYRACLYYSEIAIKNHEAAALILSAARNIHSGMKTAEFIHFSMIAECDFRISFSIDS
jgi:hypothetical protein